MDRREGGGGRRALRPVGHDACRRLARRGRWAARRDPRHARVDVRHQSTAHRQRRRAVPRRGRWRAAVGLHRCGRRRRDDQGAHDAGPDDGRRRPAPVGGDGGAPQPLRQAGPPRRGRRQLRGRGRRGDGHQARVPGPQGPRQLPAARGRRDPAGDPAPGPGRSRSARRTRPPRRLGDGGAGGEALALGCGATSPRS